MCRHYEGSLVVIVPIVPLQASPEQAKKQQEDADRAMENNHEKNRQGEQEPKERDGSEAGREVPVPQERKSGSGKAMGQQLLEAACDGDAAKVGTLLSTQGAQSFINYQDAYGTTPLHAAAHHGHAAVTTQLIAARCSVDLQDKARSTPLHIAADNGHAVITETLLAARCNVDLQTKRGVTPLHFGAQNGHAAVTQQLIVAGCNVDLQEENLCTPLHLAAQQGHEAVTKQLIVARCSVDLQDNIGNTPLHTAALRGHAAVTKQLIAARCNVDIQTYKDNATPLHFAARNGHEAITKQLLAARCTVDLQMHNGATALHAAEHKGHAGIATLIRNRKQETPLLGRRVVINGLVAKPELNGRTGTAVSFDIAKGRYSVELDDTSSSLRIKPCNLLPTTVCSVALCSLLFSHVQTLRRLS